MRYLFLFFGILQMDFIRVLFFLSNTLDAAAHASQLHSRKLVEPTFRPAPTPVFLATKDPNFTRKVLTKHHVIVFLHPNFAGSRFGFRSKTSLQALHQRSTIFACLSSICCFITI
eukprot:TRINITY_DN11945_c0_g1_i1.p2 TRINITY_DN11945_c0_g1~~TRINITY_DN11945_c0_g1_i1.p2  ORF type:complete len:115 (+),score=0.81 TRINITY_DN11945_c0_g1_i1:445-789(+)